MNAKAFAMYNINESILTVVLSLVMVVYMRIGVIGLAWGNY